MSTLDEEHEPEMRHGRTEFDTGDYTQPERDLWTAIAQRSARGNAAQSAQTDSPTGTRQKKKTPEALMKKFWSTQGLSPEEIERRYEIYTGWRYETQGWKVEYNSTLKDTGTNLICTKENRILIVQCRNWKRNAVIHEKYIHQLFGSASAYKMKAPEDSKTGAVFYTSASFSDRAKEAAKKFHIILHEQFYLERFPCIKCKSETHKYYIPDDPEYFTVSIDTENGDMFCDTVDEAESSGFSHESEVMA